MRFSVLGPLVVSGDRELPAGPRSHRRLLSILLLEHGRPVEMDALADRFWGEQPPPTWRAALQTHISQLRRTLGAGVIRTSGHGYQLSLDEQTTDVRDFDTLAGKAREAREAGAWEDAADHAAQALALWRGRPYPELEADAFAAPEIARLEETRAALLEMRGEALLALGRPEAALPDLEAAVRELPYRERLWELLMRARVRLGRTADALAAYHEARRLFDEMGLEPGPALRELEERILHEDPDLVPTRRLGNLPARRTTFVGRDGEIAEISSALETHRIVTLTGAGGSGKTRLSIEVADRLLPSLRDGAWLVDLATLDDGALVTVETAVTLGLRADGASVDEALTESLSGRQLLVVLDNCEHVVEAAARTVELLLGAGTGVRVLATSRAPLEIADERVYPVQPLGVPSVDAATPAAVGASSAARLLADRAALVSPGFAITHENAAPVAGICRRLDGIPLAIELAAARMGALSPRDVAERLDQRFKLLARNRPSAPARHRTLEAAVAWSYDHLSELQQRLFVRLSVFAGVFSLASAEAVVAGGEIGRDDVAALLAALVEQSLVVPIDAQDGRRYRLLETIRQFARERLIASVEAHEVHRRHRDHFLEATRSHRSGRFDTGWIEPIRGLHDDLEAALTWSLDADDGVEAARLATALGDYWILLGYPGRARVGLQETLDRADLHAEPEREADLRSVFSDALHNSGQLDAALAEATEAHRLMQDRPPGPEKFLALHNLASIHLLAIRADPLLGVAPAREASAVADAIGDEEMRIMAESLLGGVLVWSGADVDEGIEHKRRAVAMAERLGNPSVILPISSTLFTVLMLHPELRRTEPMALAEKIWDRYRDMDGIERVMPWGWIATLFLASGAWDRCEEVLERWARQHLEGFELTFYRYAHCCQHWMQGRLDEAAREISVTIEMPDLSPRWYHDVFNLQADIAADRGDLEQVRRTADRYLATEVTPAEESMKVGVLSPLVRAEVAAALRSEGAARTEHHRRAREARDRMQALVARYPHPTGGAVQIETAATHLLIAEAELSRLEEPDPAPWERIAEEATYAYTKAYGLVGRAEALLAIDRRRGIRALHEARERAGALGATYLVRRLDGLDKLAAAS